MVEAGIYEITKDDMVQKWYAVFRVTPELLLLIIFLLPVVMDSDSENIVDNNGETKKLVLSPSWDPNGKEDA